MAIESRNDPKDADPFLWHVFQDLTQAKTDVTALKPNSEVFVLLGINKQGPSLRQSVLTMYHGTTDQALKEILSVLDQPARVRESVAIHGHTVKGTSHPFWGVYVTPSSDIAKGYSIWKYLIRHIVKNKEGSSGQTACLGQSDNTATPPSRSD